MLNLKLEKEKIVDGIPTIQINVYDEENIVVNGIIMPFGRMAFKAYKLTYNKDGSYAVVLTTYGTSPHLNFGAYFRSGVDETSDRTLIFGQIMLCVMDFVYIQNKLNGLEGKLLAPNISFREMPDDLDQFITDMIGYNES